MLRVSRDGTIRQGRFAVRPFGRAFLVVEGEARIVCQRDIRRDAENIARYLNGDMPDDADGWDRLLAAVAGGGA